jgi:hypothetical protein
MKPWPLISAAKLETHSGMMKKRAMGQNASFVLVLPVLVVHR